MASSGRYLTGEISVSDCTLPIDIVLRSCDKVRIGAHQANLAQFSEGFPSPSDVTVADGPVDLTEGGSTLKLLMEFVVPFSLKSALARGAGAWRGRGKVHDLWSDECVSDPPQVGPQSRTDMFFTSRPLLSSSVRDFLGGEALKVLSYAVKFAYPEVADRAALYVVRGGTSIKQVADAFGPGNEANTLAWVQYREEYLPAMETMLRGSHKVTNWNGENKTCDNADGHWERYYGAVLHDLPRTQVDFFSKSVTTDYQKGYNFFSDILQRHKAHLSECSSGWCDRRVNRWEREFVGALRSIKPFHTFLPSD